MSNMPKKKNINYSYVAGVAFFFGIIAIIENRSFFQDIFSKKKLESKKYEIDTKISSDIKVVGKSSDKKLADVSDMEIAIDKPVNETEKKIKSKNDFYDKTNETKFIGYVEVDNSFNLYVYDLKGNRISSSQYIAGRDRRIKYSECIIVMVDRGNTYVYDEKLKEISNSQYCINSEDSFQVTGCNIVVKKGGASAGYTYIFDKKCNRINY